MPHFHTTAHPREHRLSGQLKNPSEEVQRKVADTGLKGTRDLLLRMCQQPREGTEQIRGRR